MLWNAQREKWAPTHNCMILNMKNGRLFRYKILVWMKYDIYVYIKMNTSFLIKPMWNKTKKMVFALTACGSAKYTSKRSNAIPNQPNYKHYTLCISTELLYIYVHLIGFLSDNERIMAENLMRHLHFKLRSAREQARIYLNKLKFGFFWSVGSSPCGWTDLIWVLCP